MAQRQAVLDLLLSAHGREVSSVALSRISLQYNARILELRELGYCITSRTERHGGKVHGYFRLESNLPIHQNMPAVVAPIASGSLFGKVADTGHFALEEEVDRIASLMHEFLDRTINKK